MPTATMTSKGQITVPKEIRDALGLMSGSQLTFAHLPNGRYALSARTRSLADLSGILYDPDRAPMTIDDINDAIAESGAASGMQGMEPSS